ncbi:MAG TPA: histidine kinase [Chthonomonadaceae bacterium]|nr:histidine kinase [Chthonomonadaceae bacterium]
MQTPASYFSVFIKDTCVLVVVAYLLSRGRLLRLLFRERLSLREVLILGICLGLAGLSLTLFPDARVPYAVPTLFITFATLVGGLPTGLVTAAAVTPVVAFQSYTIALQTHQPYQFPRIFISILLAVLISTVIGKYCRRHATIPVRLAGGFIAGALVHIAQLVVRIPFANYFHLPLLPPQWLFSIPANGFGVALLLLVVSDAQVRADSEQRRVEVERQRLEAERAHALAAAAQLSALRSRIHPHFLFNALNSIAELCCLAPERAEVASLNLSRLMRRALEKSAAATTTLQEELTMVQAYLQIEQERLGERLSVVWDIAPECGAVCLVPFAIQILVENAIHHGLAPRVGPGKITITVRHHTRHILIAIQDNGIGIGPEARRSRQGATEAQTHGLQILDQQLRLLHGDRAHLRLFSRENRGTLVAFALPPMRMEPD